MNHICGHTAGESSREILSNTDSWISSVGDSHLLDLIKSLRICILVDAAQVHPCSGLATTVLSFYRNVFMILISIYITIFLKFYTSYL